MTAATGTTSTTAARSRSLTTMTSFWSQRSTNVPAIGPRRRFGSVAATKTNPTAIGELVAWRTRKASATWWTRSPNRLISWPTHSAENDPFRASRTYGWRRARSRTVRRARDRDPRVRNAGAGSWAAAGAARPAPGPPSMRGRSSDAASSRPGASPVPPRIAPPAERVLPRPGQPCRRDDAPESGLGGRLFRVLDFQLRRPDDVSRTGRRRGLPPGRGRRSRRRCTTDRDRDDVAERAGPEEELRRRDRAARTVEPGCHVRWAEADASRLRIQIGM